ncbi:MAG: Quinoprotein glucose dehydrogenase precursor, partial [Planctomycetota bacterium]
FETSLVFADRFNQIEDGTGAGVLVRGNEAYYTCIPKLWKLTDENGDGKADKREVLYDGFGVRVAFRGHDIHGLVIGPDGRLYFSIGDRGFHVETPNGLLANPECGAIFRCELDGSKLEVYAIGLRNPQELAFDQFGNLFTGDNNSDSGDKARWVYVAPGGDSGWRMFYQYLDDRGPFNRDKLWQPYQPSTPAYIVPPIINFADGPSGLTYYPGTGLDDSFNNTFFLCDFRGGPANSGVRTIRVERDGAFFKVADSGEPIWQILATDVDFGTDGYIYISDWVNGWNGEGKGRIYRFGDPKYLNSPRVTEVQLILKKGFQNVPSEKLAEYLAHTDRRVRQEAQFELAHRGDMKAFEKVALQSTSQVARLHAIWGLGQISRSAPGVKADPTSQATASTTLVRLLTESDSEVVIASLTTLNDSYEKALTQETSNTLITLLGSENLAIRYHAALAVGRAKLPEALTAILKMLQENVDSSGFDTDPMIRHGGIMALKGIASAEQLAALASHPSKSIRLAAVVALRKQLAPQVATFLADQDPTVAAEAARAVHDEPQLHEAALQRLADILPNSRGDFAFEHRMLNAAYRLGRDRDSLALVRYASDGSRNQTLRLEALEMLNTWSDPKPNDRVLNRYLPLIQNRPTEKLIASLRASLPALVASEDTVRQKTLAVAASMGITEVVPMLTTLINNAEATPQSRSQAIDALVGLEGSKASEVVHNLIDDPAVEVRSTALRQLAVLQPSKAITKLNQRIDAIDIRERQSAWDAIALLSQEASQPLLEKGVTSLLEGTLPKDTWLNVLEAATGKISDKQATQLAEFRKSLAEQDPLGNFLHILEGGDAKVGAQLFYTRSELSCVRCHRIGSRGGEVGPVLTEIAKQKDRRYLLESVALPDAAIAQNFETAIIRTEDDDIFTGIVRQEKDGELQMVLADGRNVSISLDSVAERRKGKSSMPLDLYKYLSDREFRDLVAFLASLDGTQVQEKEEGGHGL